MTRTRIRKRTAALLAALALGSAGGFSSPAAASTPGTTCDPYSHTFYRIIFYSCVGVSSSNNAFANNYASENSADYSLYDPSNLIQLRYNGNASIRTSNACYYLYDPIPYQCGTSYPSGTYVGWYGDGFVRFEGFCYPDGTNCNSEHHQSDPNNVSVSGPW